MERREEILRAALTVFSHHGYHKASIKQIAKAAGLKSTSHLYWYFQDKRALFNAVLTELSPISQVNPEMMESVMQEPPELVLPLIANAIVSVPDDVEIQQLFRLYMSEAIRSEEVAEVASDFHNPFFSFLKGYLVKPFAFGRLRPHDVQISARVWVSSLIINILASQVFKPMAEGMPERDEYIRGVVDLFLKGLENDRD